MEPRRKNPLKTAVTLLIVGACTLIALFSTFIVWIPDIFTGSRHTIGSLNANGHSFTVVQYWNHADFYSTELYHLFPDGHTTMDTLDGDDMKSWHTPIAVDEHKRIVTVILSGHRSRSISY